MTCQKNSNLLEEETFPSGCGLFLDFFNLFAAAIGYVSLIVGLTSVKVVGPSLKHEAELNKNITAICLAFVASLLIGSGAAMTKILCSFKDYRIMTHQ